MSDPDDALTLFRSWYEQAIAAEPNDANAMFLVTADDTGMPNVRVVLMKEMSENGLVFYTNLESAKGLELLNSNKAAVCFEWKSLNRRIVISGQTGLVNDEEADTYYQSRARQSRLGAWASQQSRPLKSKMHLLKQVAKIALKYPIGSIPRPPHWSGFRLVADRIEFLQHCEGVETSQVVFKSSPISTQLLRQPSQSRA